MQVQRAGDTGASPGFPLLVVLDAATGCAFEGERVTEGSSSGTCLPLPISLPLLTYDYDPSHHHHHDTYRRYDQALGVAGLLPLME